MMAQAPRPTPSLLIASIPRCKTDGQYFLWRRKVQIAAGPSNVWSLINGTEEIPQEEERDAQMTYRLSEAMVIVTTNISDQLITRTINCTNAREVWLSIETYFQSAAARNKYSNRNKFNRTELLENETIDELADTIRKLTFQLRSGGERITEADQLTSLLGAVEKDERFISITTILESNPEVTFEQAFDKLLA
jgi:hypothetical protein